MIPDRGFLYNLITLPLFPHHHFHEYLKKDHHYFVLQNFTIAVRDRNYQSKTKDMIVIFMFGCALFMNDCYFYVWLCTIHD
jgi:hypothetical protein